MKLEVLIATMHQKDRCLLNQMNIQSDAVVVNQCDNDHIECFDYCGHQVLWINSTERGLSRSRNMAMKRASADICVFADDDIRYYDGYPSAILNAFLQLPDSEILTFNINTSGKHQSIVPIKKVRKAPRNKYYGSIRLAFRRQPVVDARLRFHEEFGAGAIYRSGEESLFLREARNAGLSVYENPHYIADVDYSSSSWFEGYTEKYYFDKGAFLAAAYGNLAIIYSAYFLLQSMRISKLPVWSVYRAMRKGMKAYRYEQQSSARSCNCQ